jgi:hypothetical protein
VTSNPSLSGAHAKCALPAALSLCAALLSGSSIAHAADPACDSLPKPIIYGRGGSAASVLIGRFAVAVAESSDPFTVVYKDDGACFAMDALINAAKPTTSAKYWIRQGDGTIVAKTCTLPATVEDAPDASWGAMAQQATTCNGVDSLPANISDQRGPNSGFSIVVPKASTQQVISSEAIYFIYGFGPDDPKYQVAPWTVPLAIGSRATTSAAGLLLAKAVGIPLSHTLYGTDAKNNQGSIDYITKTSQAAKDNPEAAIAFASTETADANRATVRALAFQAEGQKHGYWPDSNANALDKINLREGRYFLWNPHHFFAKLDGNGGQIADANTKKWIGYLTGTLALPKNNTLGKAEAALDLQIEVGTVPACAMHVDRDTDVGPLQSYQPDEPCTCYFELQATGRVPDSCKACTSNDGTTDAACPSSASVCRHGYCEVK